MVKSFSKDLIMTGKKFPSRTSIIQEIINHKKYKNYLEIGCDNDENFSKIQIENKIE